ncbi:MAG TPA: Uma2 family endonuclease [Solirubrobacteraceae bacterium]|nr:Uma2 family endonuclease [Solirubrobacteraceae bacterium]
MAVAPAVVFTGISSAEYLALAQRGVLDEARVELIDGRIVSVTPQSDEHAYVLVHLTELLALAGGLHVQAPLVAGPTSVPEPDLALAQRRGIKHPVTARLVIEVVWSQWHEAMRKLPLYAAADVGECWIVDIPKRVVHVHDRPSGREYGRTRKFTGSDVLKPPCTTIRFTAADVFARLDE